MNKLLNLQKTIGLAKCNLHTTSACNEIQKMSRLRVVDNSDIGKQAMAEGKPPKCIHVYNKTGIGKIGLLLNIFYCYYVTHYCDFR